MPLIILRKPTFNYFNIQKYIVFLYNKLDIIVNQQI